MALSTLSVRRLLRLARILDNVALKRKRYDQTRFRHKCGTPACALGYWAASTPRRWMLNRDGHPVLRSLAEGNPSYRHNSVYQAADDFDLSIDEAYDLFSGAGCGYAERSAKRAAAFIRAFVAERKAA